MKPPVQCRVPDRFSDTPPLPPFPHPPLCVPLNGCFLHNVRASFRLQDFIAMMTCELDNLEMSAQYAVDVCGKFL